MSFKANGLDVIIKKTALIPAGPVPAIPYSAGYPGTLPAYCRVDGVIDERIGHDGKPYAIGFAIALPENWNGRFMMQGGGGLNGSVAQPLGTVAAGDKPALERGFAIITTDSGHQGAHGFDASFFADEEASLNFLYQAVGKVAQVGKQIITAMRTSFSNLADRWVATSLNQVAPKDEQGKPITSRALSDGDRKLVIDSLLKSCDANDGVADGMIFNPAGCGFDVMKLACKGPKTDACLSVEQATAIQKGFSGPKDSRGVQVYPGFFFDTGIAEKQGIPGLLNPGGSPVGPPASDKMNIDQEEL
ncbi:MAG: tannase/feruloyl esterase family alpha/beta hydrolase, partial [Steroidobacter sp.]